MNDLQEGVSKKVENNRRVGNDLFRVRTWTYLWPTDLTLTPGRSFP